MSTKCPKKSIAATFLYLENLRKEGIFNATEENVEYVVDKISSIFQGYKENLEKEQENSKYTVGNPLNFNLITKSSLSSVNFENVIEKTMGLNKNQQIKTNYDLYFDEQKERNLGPVANYDYSDIYAFNFPKTDDNQMFYIGKNMETVISQRLAKLFGEIIDMPAVIEEALKNNTFANIYSEYVKISIPKAINEKAFKEASSKVDTGTIKVNKISLNENVITLTNEVLEGFQRDNPNYLTVSSVNLDDDEVSYMQNILSGIATKQISDTLVDIVGRGDISKLSDILNRSVVNELFEYGKINDKIDNLLLRYTDRKSSEINDIHNENEDSITASLRTLSSKMVSATYSKGTKEDKVLMIDEAFLTYEKLNEEDLSQYISYGAVVKEMTVSFLKGSKVFFQINELNDGAKPNYFTMQSENLSKTYFYGKDVTKEFKNIAIDEADKGISGKGVNIYYAMAKDAKNVIVGTGTASEGYASGVTPLFGFSGNFTPSEINTNLEEFKTLCDKWTIRDAFIGELVAASAIDEDIGILLKNSIIDFIHNKNESKGFSTSKFATEAGIMILSMMAESFPEKSDVLSKFDMSQIASQLGRFYDASYKATLDRNTTFDLTRSPKDIVLSVLLNNRNFLNRYPGISNVGTYANQIGSFGDVVNISIGTRQTILKRKEEMNILDLRSYNRVAKNTSVYRDLSVDNLHESNDMGVRIASRVLKDYSTVNMIPQIKNFLSSNFDNFINSLESKKLTKSVQIQNQNVLLEMMKEKTGNEELVYKDIVAAVSKSTTQSPDDASTLYRQAMSVDFRQSYFINVLKLQNKNLPEDVRNIREQKLSIFSALVQIYKELFLDKGVLSNIESKSDEKEESILLKTEYGAFSLAEVFTPKFTSIIDGKVISVSPHEIEFSENTIPKGMKFSKKIELYKERWNDFIDVPIEYIYKYGNEKEEEILDLYGSKNLEKNIDNEINEGRNTIIASSRMIGVIINTIDTVVSAAKRENKEKPYVIIVNISDPYAKEMISQIDEDKLKENNIEIVPVTRTMLDPTIKQYAKKDVQMSINSNYQSIARGLDLSMQDSIIAAGSFTNGRELIQFLSRLYSVDKAKADIYMFNGGQDVSFFTKNDELSCRDSEVATLLRESSDSAKEKLEELYKDMIIMPSYSSMLNERGYEKMLMNQKFMGGAQADVYHKTTHLVEVVKDYKKIISPDVPIIKDAAPHIT